MTAPAPGADSAGIRRLLLIRYGPVTALSILVAVCVTCLGFILRDFAALTSVAPLVAVIAAFVWSARAR
jgi:hypothetical protein